MVIGEGASGREQVHFDWRQHDQTEQLPASSFAQHYAQIDLGFSTLQMRGVHWLPQLR